jgi:hypothetical protein
MAVFTHSVGVTYKTAAGSITNTTDSFTADGEVNVQETIVADGNPVTLDVVLDPTKIHSMVMYSDQALTVKTNSNTSRHNLTGGQKAEGLEHRPH